LYIVADPAPKETIIKNARRAPKAIMIPYSRVRDALPGSFTATGLSADFLNARADEAENSNSQRIARRW